MRQNLPKLVSFWYQRQKPKNTAMRKFFILLTLGIFSMSSYAQSEDSPWRINIDLTNNKFHYHIWEGLFDFGQLDNSGFRVGAQRYLNNSLDLEFGIGYGKLIYEQIFKSNVLDANVNLIYKFDNGYILKKESKIAPFISAGIGTSNYSNFEGINFGNWEGNNFDTPIGVGVEFKVAEDASIQLGGIYHSNGAPDYLQYRLGVNFTIGKKKDSDKDGVYDKEDACPNTAGPAENKGCPWPDTDGDGVLDKDDACPTEAGTLNGCPDSDGDGIKDSEDTCPNTAGIAKFNGCPDTDGDGIKDSEDQCPNQAGTLNGCPDSDGDGIKDSDDQCPRLAGTLNGCPDSDGDGIRDQDDTCPQVAGVTANNGCPEIKEEVKEALDLAVKNIQFNSGSDVLKSSSYTSLNQVAELMKENTSFNLKLTGYTDNTGNVDKNLELSKRRAASAKAYLVSQGIDADRLSSDGYGIANPVADNKTRAGRAANRRVELEIVFK